MKISRAMMKLYISLADGMDGATRVNILTVQKLPPTPLIHWKMEIRKGLYWGKKQDVYYLQ